MTVEGFIYGENNQPVKALVSLIDPVAGVQVMEILPGEKYTVSNGVDAGTMEIIFSSEGYKSLKTTVADLQNTGANIHLEKSNQALTWLLVALAGWVIIAKNKKKKVGALKKDDIIPVVIIAGAVLGFSVIKKLLESLGIWDSPETKRLDRTASSGNNWWNPDYYKSKPSFINYTNPITLSRAKQLAQYLYDQFNFLNDDEEAAIAVFKSLPSQAAGSFVSEAFRDMFGIDMLTFLRGGAWPQDRLSDDDVDTINTYMFSLPKY